MKSLRQYWSTLSRRERRISVFGILVALSILFYTLLWAPLQDDLNRLRNQVRVQSVDLAWMQEQYPVVKGYFADQNSKKQTRNLPLLTIIDQTSRKYRIRHVIKQIQPGKEEGTARVWFDQIVFEDWLRWLGQISGRGIAIQRVSITRSSNKPLVNIRLELTAP